MPFVRIALRAGTTPEYRKAIADGVHQTMLDSIAIPTGDRFQVITEHSAEDLIYDPSYLDVKRSDKIVFVQITLSGAERRHKNERSSNAWQRFSKHRPGCGPRIC
jgi:hypothetical protein